jgi:signal transduction histidine kinase
MSDTPFAELISKIAHELRSPLTSVKGFSATLVKRWDSFTDDQKLQFVTTIHSDAERMARIVSEVLDLARLEAGRLELHATTTSIAAIAERATANVKELDMNGRITCNVDESLTGWADAERLEHILTNLLENAVKFSDEGPIEVAASHIDGAVRITVADKGVGIESELLPHLFDGPSRTGQRAGPSGTGLGLYLTRRLVEAHGGSIEVSSGVGSGSVFTIMLPAGDET